MCQWPRSRPKVIPRVTRGHARCYRLSHVGLLWDYRTRRRARVRPFATVAPVLPRGYHLGGVVDERDYTTDTTVVSARHKHEAKLPPSTASSTSVNCLRYLADSTRPDLAFISGLLGRYSHDPCQRHRHAVQRLFLYLRHISTHGFTYTNLMLSQSLLAYSHSDYASCLDTRRSTSGFVAFRRHGPIAWLPKHQKFVASSTWEAEYIFVFHASQHTNCLWNLLHDFRALELSIPIPFTSITLILSLLPNSHTSPPNPSTLT